VQINKAACCCLPFLAGNSSLSVNTPSNSGNVYFVNGQTDRILRPYSCHDLVNRVPGLDNVITRFFIAESLSRVDDLLEQLLQLKEETKELRLATAASYVKS
jgi:hypothetical protein